jgi:hypothetical protein
VRREKKNRRLISLPHRSKSKPQILLGVVALTAVASFAIALAVSAQQSDLANVPMATLDRIKLSAWWPTKGAAPREEYIGPLACATCHSVKSALQKTTPMAHASTEAVNSEILRSHERLNFQSGPFRYEIASSAGGSVYSVHQAAKSVTVQLGWAFGYGEVGQTYVYQQDGSFYESRLSYYRELQALDITTGHSRSTVATLAEAAGRALDPEETQHCFGCHSTASTTNNRFDLGHLIPGVSCEACHGPGAQHAVAMQAEDFEQGKKLIFTPHGLSPVQSVEFCGACHRTKWDVAMAGITGAVTVRFQPYRLETSKCWGESGDARLTCFSCHDPHKPLVHDLGSYDDRCLKCHAANSHAQTAQLDHPAPACPVSDKNCVTCHMPKYELSEMHSKFTDHRIRVVRKGEPFPG